jgi:LPXTG-motif cell wall-anchored protein
VTKEATTEAEGEETRKCACGETEKRIIPMLEVEQTEEAGSDNTWIIIVAAVAVVAVVAVVIVVKKKK